MGLTLGTAENSLECQHKKDGLDIDELSKPLAFESSIYLDDPIQKTQQDRKNRS